MYEQEKWEVRKVARTLIGEETDTAEVGLFPTFARRTVTVTPARRSALRAHLQHEHDATDPAPRNEARLTESPGPHHLPVGPICAMCRGFCCVPGGNHGFIATATLRIAEARLAAGNIVDHYMSYVPQRAYAGSCIFHAATGCTLPRDLRSDICNRHLCPPLAKIAADWIETPARPVIAAFVAPDGERRITVVRDFKVREVRQVRVKRVDPID